MTKEECAAIAAAEVERYTFALDFKSDLNLMFKKLISEELAHLPRADVQNTFKAVVANLALGAGAELKTSYVLRTKDGREELERLPTRLAAEMMLKLYEENDSLNGVYSPDFYEIVEKIQKTNL